MSSFDAFTQTTPAPRRPIPLGQLVFGLILLVVGVSWLLSALDLFEVPWRAVLAAVLILVGGALLGTARDGVHGGLVTTGVALVVVLSLAATAEGVFDVPFSGGVGDRTVAPATALGVREPVRLAVGQLTVDLTDTELSAVTTLEASVMVGGLVIRVPDEVAIEIEGSIGAGQLIIDRGPEFSGMGVDEVYRDPNFATAPVRLRIEASVGLGQIEVRR